MKYLILFVFGSFMFVAGCGGDTCGAGFVRIGAACVPVETDAGVETCNGMDDDLDGAIDEEVPGTGIACGTDEGECTAGVFACTEGVLACNDTVPVDETCNGLDDDCDETVDEGLLTTYYLDGDEDGAGGETTCDACTASECGAGVWVEVGGDCDDTCPTCLPDGVETCDALDNDCDESVDEEVTEGFYVDMDGDGYGVGDAVQLCREEDGAVPAGYAEMDGDCGDGDERARPNQRMFFDSTIEGEVPSGLLYDYNCDGDEVREHGPCAPATCRNGQCYGDVISPRFQSDAPCGDPAWLRGAALVTIGVTTSCIVTSSSMGMEGTVACQ